MVTTMVNPVARETSYAALYRASYADLLRFLQRRCPHDQAEDVLAEVWTVAWRRWDDVPTDPDRARAWLFGVARRTLLASGRQQRRRESLAVRLSEALPDEDDHSDLAARRVDLTRAWPLLTDGQQEVLTLAVLDELPSADAARVLGITPVAFRIRLSRARSALRAHLDQQES